MFCVKGAFGYKGFQSRESAISKELCPQKKSSVSRFDRAVCESSSVCLSDNELSVAMSVSCGSDCDRYDKNTNVIAAKFEATRNYKWDKSLGKLHSFVYNGPNIKG